MCAVKWDMIKTINDQDTVEDVSSDSDIEVEVLSCILFTFVQIFIIVYAFSINRKNIRPKVIHILTMNLSFCLWLQNIIMTHGMICKSI